MKVKAAKALPPAEVVWERFEYNPLTGTLYRRKTGRRSKLGEFGCVSTLGYREGMLDRKMYKAHRLIWLWVTGEDPGAMEVDHIDRNRLNNAWNNLRKVPANKQSWNTNCYSNNQLGVRGVKAIPGTSKFQARIRIHGKLINLGSYNNIEDASAAYERANARRASSIETTVPGA